MYLLGQHRSFSGDSAVKGMCQQFKRPRRPGIQFSGWEESLEEGNGNQTLVFLLGKSHGQRTQCVQPMAPQVRGDRAKAPGQQCTLSVIVCINISLQDIISGKGCSWAATQLSLQQSIVICQIDSLIYLFLTVAKIETSTAISFKSGDSNLQHLMPDDLGWS